MHRYVQIMTVCTLAITALTLRALAWAAPAPPGDWYINLYADGPPRDSMHRITVLGEGASTGDLEKFSDWASAVRYRLPQGWRAIMFDEKNFKGSPYYLIGTGEEEEIPDLGSFDDKVSSIRVEKHR